GGVVSGIMDETMGRAVMFNGSDVWGVTVALELRFRQPVPLFVELTAVGRVVKDRGSYFEGAGEMLLPDGTVAVEAKGKFWKLPLGEIADFDTDREQWRVVPDA
ncbi:MAG: hotdog fold domain-containing protein, partial [Anaerolineae bacterium]